MDFDTVHRENLALFSKLFEESPYMPQIDEGCFSSSANHVQGQGRVVDNRIDHHFVKEGFSNYPFSMFHSSSYDPFDPFQASLNQEFYGFADSGSSSLMNGSQSNNRSFEFGTRVSSQTLEHYSFDQTNYESPLALQKMNSAEGECSSLILNHDGENRKMNKEKQKVQTRKKRIVDTKSEIIKGQWTPEEDGLLVGLVEKHGVRKWSSIAQMLPGRIGKQCRERWHNHLKPNIKKDRWSEEEDMILIEVHRQLGNRWAEIARSLPGRSENTIKNHWNATKRRQLSGRRNNNNDSKSDSPLQSYLRSLASKSKGKGISENSSSASNSSPADHSNKKSVISKQGNGFSNLKNSIGAADESFKLMQAAASLDAHHRIHMQVDLQKEVDFMEMISFGSNPFEPLLEF